MAGKTGLPGRVAVGKFVCTECKMDFCEGCLDVKRSIYSSERLCQCQKKSHEQEVDDAISVARGSTLF